MVKIVAIETTRNPEKPRELLHFETDICNDNNIVASQNKEKSCLNSRKKWRKRKLFVWKSVMNKYEYALEVIEKHLPERNDTGYFVRMLEITEALETLKELVERYGKDDHV